MNGGIDMITSKNKKKAFVSLATTENIGISVDPMNREEAEEIFLLKMKIAEEAIARGECMTSAQAHEFLGV